MTHDEHKDSAQKRLGQGLEDWLRATPAAEEPLDELFDLLDGKLSPESASSLRQRIAEDPQLAQHWQQIEEDVGEWAVEPSENDTPLSNPRRLWLAVAASLLVGAVALAWFGLRTAGPSPASSTPGTETSDVVADSRTENRFNAAAELRRLRAEATFVLPPQLDDLRPPSGVLRDAGPVYRSDDFRPQPIAPVGTFTLEAPTLRWTPVPGAVGYDVVVTTLSFEEVATVQGLHEEASWQPDTSSWPRGTPLTWQVTAHLGDGRAIRAPVPPAAEARFGLLDSPTANEVAGLLRQAELAFEDGAISPPELRLLKAKVLAATGLVELARNELEGLDSPGDQALIESLYASLAEAPNAPTEP